MQPWSREMVGRLDEHWIESEALESNPLGDPSRRPLWVYVPPGYDEAESLPSIYVIQGLTGQLDMWRNRAPFRPSAIERIDALFAEQGAPPCVVVFVDCWTRLGGSQFVDSPGTGDYHSFLCDEVVPFVDERYATLAASAHRGIAGKSSGGYGAMITPMLRPDLFGGFATHSGDALFEACFGADFRQAARLLRDNYDGSFEKFWDEFASRPAFSRDGDGVLLNTYCMAACWSTDEDGQVQIPFELTTGKLIPEVFERWLAWDPVRMVPKHAETLRAMRAIYIDCGTRDEYFLDLGAEAFRRALSDVGVTDVFFELFDGTHKAIGYRYPIGLRYLAERLR